MSFPWCWAMNCTRKTRISGVKAPPVTPFLSPSGTSKTHRLESPFPLFLFHSRSLIMLTLLAYVHILIGIGLVMFVLLQDPKGGAMGVFSGGSSSNTFFGSSGATNFLTTTTRWLAILFAISCLTLTYMTAKRG